MSRFTVLPGLPGHGPLPIHFSGSGSVLHSEGFVVEFCPESSVPWVGNFQEGASQFHRVFDHPDEKLVIVVAGGCGYVIDPWSRKLIESFGVCIDCAFEIPTPKRIVFGNGLWFESYAECGRQWKTPQISFDGMRSLRLVGEELLGEAWDSPADKWVPFSLDLRSGKVTGGAWMGLSPRSDG